MSKLTIISHTEHYKTPDGTIVGYGPTVTEINNLLEIFDDIQHIAMLHDKQAPVGVLPYLSDKIVFKPLPALGGNTIQHKLNIIVNAPKVLNIVRKAVRDTDYFQFRAPTGIGTFIIPYLIMFSSKKGWFKYAGNWKQEKAPLAYSFQRWLLKSQNRYVTINGVWLDQPNQCLTFENPCLTIEELSIGQKTIKEKEFDNTKLIFCFVGRLETEKGLDLLINAFKSLRDDEKSKIKTIHIIGKGKQNAIYQKMAQSSGLNFVFHGFLSRIDVHGIYKQSHAIILPSMSEGFPKVIAEAMNYGCLPIVSNISSIAHYVNDEVNGFLFFPITLENLIDKMKKMLNLSDFQYANMIKAQNQELKKFTYTYYNKRIREELLSE